MTDDMSARPTATGGRRFIITLERLDLGSFPDALARALDAGDAFAAQLRSNHGRKPVLGMSGLASVSVPSRFRAVAPGNRWRARPPTWAA
jgi:hypothetical protein